MTWQEKQNIFNQGKTNFHIIMSLIKFFNMYNSSIELSNIWSTYLHRLRHWHHLEWKRWFYHCLKIHCFPFHPLSWSLFSLLVAWKKVSFSKTQPWGCNDPRFLKHSGNKLEKLNIVQKGLWYTLWKRKVQSHSRILLAFSNKNI